MKKVIIFFGCILFLNASFSQNSVVVTEQNDFSGTKSSLIKEYRYPSTITCLYNEDESASFIYSDQTLQTKEFNVPGLKVNDMSIKKNGTSGQYDTLYFCGKNMRTGMATFGYFNINDFFNTVGHIYLHDSIFSGYGLNRVYELTRMTSYENGTGLHYVCIGTTENNYPCVVDFSVAPMTIWYYRSGTVLNATETMFDIKYVNTYQKKYLVTAGMDTSYHKNYLNLRIYDIIDIFAPSGIQEMKHVFCIDTLFGVPWNRDDVLLKRLSTGYFATVSYLNEDLYNNVTGSTFPYHSNSIHEGVFDLNTMLAGSLSGMITSSVFEPQDLTFNTLRDIVNGQSGTYAFLERFQYDSTHKSSNYYEFKLDASMNVSIVKEYNTLDNVYCGLDSYNSYNNYVMSGFEDANTSALKYDMETFLSGNTCNAPLKCNYIHYNPYRSINKSQGFVTAEKRSNYSTVEVHTQSAPLTIICNK